MVNDVAFVVIFLSFLFMSLFQVFFLCYFADLLMTAVSKRIYYFESTFLSLTFIFCFFTYRARKSQTLYTRANGTQQMLV